MAQMMSQGASGAGMLVATIISLANLTAPIAIWLIANQIQLLSLLLLTKAFLPPSVKQILTGSQYTSFSFSFIPVMDIPGINIPLKALDIQQEDLNLQEMGLNSGSSFTSNIMFFLFILFLIIVHLLTLLIPKCKKYPNEK